jgi:hypothetical protein
MTITVNGTDITHWVYVVLFIWMLANLGDFFEGLDLITADLKTLYNWVTK